MSSGFLPKKNGWLANFQASMSPQIKPDDDSPIVRPRMVTIASVVAMIGAVIFIFTGVLAVSTVQQSLDSAVTDYNKILADCKATVGGYGTTLASAQPSTLSSQAATCRTYKDLTAADKDSAKTRQQIFAIVFILMGLGAGAAAWFMRAGVRWARWTLIGVGAVSLVLVALFQVSSPLTLLATLLLIVSLTMTFIGRGGLFFTRTALQRKGH